ncbi:uncharacterized protein BDR25DRAFT_309153 [Lindgomyces ingoldianus]|uniref:Uncharacterized protein n=1 Tax=Lindgomyces ingoldianus TaxID=673940 RepID=A0ACB6RJ96_9PLEO|nr:uncharacterized protein BDR25DRAFT_309153 [Lindgomyces ingoldianus]KAF2478402.1 hypothetical protein BDR25DRAFT_309153 [Lindgomyces ingoldianus]
MDVLYKLSVLLARVVNIRGMQRVGPSLLNSKVNRSKISAEQRSPPRLATELLKLALSVAVKQRVSTLVSVLLLILLGIPTLQRPKVAVYAQRLLLLLEVSNSCNLGYMREDIYSSKQRTLKLRLRMKYRSHQRRAQQAAGALGDVHRTGARAGGGDPQTPAGGDWSRGETATQPRLSAASNTTGFCN